MRTSRECKAITFAAPSQRVPQRTRGSRTVALHSSYVNIKVYYFSISISDRTRNFLIYTRGKIAVAVEPMPGIVLRYRAGCEKEREKESEVTIFAALALQTKPTPTCVRLFLLLLFLFSARFCRLSLMPTYFPSSPLSFRHPAVTQERWRSCPKNILLKFTAWSLRGPSRPDPTKVSSLSLRGCVLLTRRTGFPSELSPMLPVLRRDLRRCNGRRVPFGFSRVTRASAARAWCSLRAQWAVSLCGSQDDIAAQNGMQRRHTGRNTWKAVTIYIGDACTQFCARQEVNPKKTFSVPFFNVCVFWSTKLYNCYNYATITILQNTHFFLNILWKRNAEYVVSYFIIVDK